MLSNVFTHSFSPYGIKSFKLILNTYLKKKLTMRVAIQKKHNRQHFLVRKRQKTVSLHKKKKKRTKQTS